MSERMVEPRRSPTPRVIGFDPAQAERRFWPKVQLAANGCWTWTAAKDPKGYGRFGVGSKKDGTQRIVLAHRLAYELIRGPIPDGLHVDHLCRNASCVNPFHMEPVTLVENFLRGTGRYVVGDFQRSKTHCPEGHPYTEANTYRSPGKPNGRQCRTCRTERERRERARRREQRSA